MPSIVRMPKFTFGSNPVDNLPGLGGPVKSGVKAVGGFADDALRGGRSLFSRSPRKAPKVPSTRPSLFQAGDDVVRAVNDATPAPPARGLAPNASTVAERTGLAVKTGIAPWAKNTALAGGAVGLAGAGIYAVRSGGGGGGGDDGGILQTPLKDFGEGLRDALTGISEGLVNLFAGAGAGAGAGVGAGAYNTLAGVGEGIKKAAVPAALVGLGVILFLAAKKRVDS